MREKPLEKRVFQNRLSNATGIGAPFSPTDLSKRRFMMNKAQNSTQAIHSAILKILRPLVLLCIKNRVSYGTIASLLKWLYYDVAKKDFIIEGRKQTNSRISVLTGFSRKQVKRLSELGPPESNHLTDQYNRIVQVISGWLTDKDYVNDRGKPLSILLSGQGATFDELVKRYSGDMPTRAVLDELMRTESVKWIRGNRLKLIKDTYLPQKNDAVMFSILGKDVGSLIATIGHNIDPDTGEPFFQRNVTYNNVPEKFLRNIRKSTGKRSNKLLNSLDKYLSSRDRDVNSKVKGDGRFEVGVGIYYFEKPFPEDD